jgi:hypothetical protein
MAHATEIKQRVAELIFGDETLEIVEVPVSIRYSAASLQKGQSSAGAVTIVRDLIHRFLFEGPK